MNTNFIFDYEFDGDINKLINAVKTGDAIQYNGKKFPVSQAFMQGKQLVLPLHHKNVYIDLSTAIIAAKKSKTQITMNIGK